MGFWLWTGAGTENLETVKSMLVRADSDQSPSPLVWGDQDKGDSLNMGTGWLAKAEKRREARGVLLLYAN